MLESVYSAKVRKFVEERGGMFLVNTASIYDKVGRADVEILYKGVIIFAELKTGNYKPTDLQIVFLQNVRKNGGIGVVLRDNLDELKVIFHLIDTGHISTYEQPALPVIEHIDLFEGD